MFLLHTIECDYLEANGLTFSEFICEYAESMFDITVQLLDGPAGINGEVIYLRELYKDEAIGQMINCFQRVLEGVVGDPGRHLSELSPPERRRRPQVATDWDKTEPGHQGKYENAVFGEKSKTTAVTDAEACRTLGRARVTPANGDSKCLEPRSNLHKLLAAIWAESLKLESVWLNDNFFDLGGQSLPAFKILSLIRTTLGVQLRLRDFFVAPTLSEFADLMIAREIRPGQTEGAARIVRNVQAMTRSEVRQALERTPSI